MNNEFVLLLNEQDSTMDKLNLIHDALNQNTIPATELAQCIEHNEDIQKFKRYILDMHKIGKKLSQYEIETLSILVMLVNRIFNYTGLDEFGVTDIEYDALHDFLEESSTVNVLSGPLLKSSSPIVYHKHVSLRGTLDKVYYLSDDEERTNGSRQSLSDWIRKTENRYKSITGKSIDLSNEEVYLFRKFDGVSEIFEVGSDGNIERSLLRGFTELNETTDNSYLFKGLTFPAKGYPYATKTEIMMKDSVLDEFNEKYNTKYKQTRAIVSGLLNSLEPHDGISMLTIVPLRTSRIIDGVESRQELADGVFDYPHLRCRLCDVDTIRKWAYANKNTDGLRCDGVVIYIIDEDIQEVLGREDEKNKFEVAFKFTEEEAYTTIEDVEFETGLFGTIVPVAIVKPVVMKGNTIQRISLGSYGRFKSLLLGKGDTVKILYDIIPYLVYDVNDMRCKRGSTHIIEAPLCCPDCNEPLTENATGNIISCNNQSCSCRIKGKILNFFQKMRIDGISYETISTLYSYGYLTSIEDIYTLHKKATEIKKLENFGDTSVNNILIEIDNHRVVNDYELLGSIGITSIGRKIFKKVLDVITFDELLDFCADENINILTCIEGVKEKTALKIIEGINMNKKLIQFLCGELDIIHTVSDVTTFTVCFTKIRSDRLEKLIESKGGIATDDFNKSVDYLVVPDKLATSSKTEKAKKWNIPILVPSELEELLYKMR